MLILIDVVIGPLLGWLVYKEGKKTLKFDLSFVIILQVCAFSYGFYTIAQGRPAWIVYDSSSFIVVKNSDINWQDGNFFKKNLVKLHGLVQSLSHWIYKINMNKEITRYWVLMKTRLFVIH